jgi:hypothetical protein
MRAAAAALKLGLARHKKEWLEARDALSWLALAWYLHEIEQRGLKPFLPSEAEDQS